MKEKFSGAIRKLDVVFEKLEAAVSFVAAMAIPFRIPTFILWGMPAEGSVFVLGLFFSILIFISLPLLQANFLIAHVVKEPLLRGLLCFPLGLGLAIGSWKLMGPWLRVVIRICYLSVILILFAKCSEVI